MVGRGGRENGPAAPRASGRPRHLSPPFIAAGLGAALAIAYPLLLATGYYSTDQLTTYAVLVAVAVACHLADWWDGALVTTPAAAPTAVRGRPRGWRLGWPAPLPGESRLGALPISATTLMRGVVVLLTLSFLLVGASELLSGIAGQPATTTGGAMLTASDQAVGGGLTVAAAGLALLVQFAGSSRVPGFRLLREDRPISWFAALVVLLAFAQLLAPTSGSQSIASAIAAPTTAADLVTGSLPFGVIAILAVGPLVARSPRQAALRLGLAPLHPAWWAIGIAAGLLLVPGVDAIFTPLQDHLLPADCVMQQNAVQQSLSGGSLGRGWAPNIAIALAAGIDEELLFRGVLLPRFGLLLSSLLFGAFHVQYTCHGLPALGDLEIVLLGVAFGLLRITGGLPAAILGHAAYDGSILLDHTAPRGLVPLLLPVVILLALGLRRRIRPGQDTEAALLADPNPATPERSTFHVKR